MKALVCDLLYLGSVTAMADGGLLSFIFQKGSTSGSHATSIQNLFWESGQLYVYCMNED